MSRKKMTRKSSNAYFKKTANRTRALNSYTFPRGGVRL